MNLEFLSTGTLQKKWMELCPFAGQTQRSKVKKKKLSFFFTFIPNIKINLGMNSFCVYVILYLNCYLDFSVFVIHSINVCFIFSSYLIRPSSLSPQPSPLIDERKFHSNQTMTKREEPTGADNPDTESKCQRDCSNTHPETQRFGKAKSLSALEEKPDISCDMRKSRTFSPADLRVVFINF